jgi:hypothetical protein
MKISEERREALARAMAEMPEHWRGYWCNSKACACLGCANRVGGLVVKGFTQAEWQDWKERQPSSRG